MSNEFRGKEKKKKENVKQPDGVSQLMFEAFVNCFRFFFYSLCCFGERRDRDKLQLDASTMNLSFHYGNQCCEGV